MCALQQAPDGGSTMCPQCALRTNPNTASSSHRSIELIERDVDTQIDAFRIARVAAKLVGRCGQCQFNLERSRRASWKGRSHVFLSNAPLKNYHFSIVSYLLTPFLLSSFGGKDSLMFFVFYYTIPQIGGLNYKHLFLRVLEGGSPRCQGVSRFTSW